MVEDWQNRDGKSSATCSANNPFHQKIPIKSGMRGKQNENPVPLFKPPAGDNFTARLTNTRG